MKKLILIVTLFTIILSCQAQNDSKANAFLDKASAAYKNAGGVQAAFMVQVVNPGGKKGNNINGTIQLKGKKFKLEVSDMITWFDGTNQWVYQKSNQEVNVSNPSDEEQLTINPVNVFQLYKFGYTAKMGGERTVNGKPAVLIFLSKQDKYSQLEGITVAFDKFSFRPLTIGIRNKDQSGTDISIPTYRTGLSFSDKKFVFPANEYPSTQVIDLR